MKLLQGFALTAALCAISANPGFAATFTVTNTLDSGAGSLRDAIDLANNTAGDDIIDFLLASGPQTINLYSTLGITSNLNINGLGADLLTVRGNSIFNVFNIGDSANAGISGLTISGGRSYGIYNSGTATVSNSTLSGNYEGIRNNYGTATVSNSTFSGNYEGIRNYYGTATVSNSTFSGNNYGIDNFGTATVSNSTLSGNGVGIYNRSDTATATVSNSTLSGNKDYAIRNDGTATVSNSTLSGNPNHAILNYGTGTLSNSTISGSYSGIFNYGTATLSNSTLSGNGDGIFNYGTATLSNSTLSGNSRNGIDNYGTTNIGNTIIAQNQRDVINRSNRAIINDNGYNLIGNGDGTIFQNGVNGNIVGTAASQVDAKLGPLADNGGPTLTYALLAGSAAIDAGNPNSFLATDQRGISRPQGGRADIGAFEVAQATPPQSVPEPSAILGLAALGLFGFLHKKVRLCR